MESSDKLNELFADGNEFTLHRLLSDFGANDLNIDMTDLAKFDPMKLFDVRSLSEYVSNKNDWFFPLGTKNIPRKKPDRRIWATSSLFSLSLQLQCDSSDQINDTDDIQSNQFDSIPPSAMACSSGSFTELRPPTPELSTGDMFHLMQTQLKTEPEHPLIYTQLDSFDNFAITPVTSTPMSQEFSFDPSIIAAFEHDYGVFSKPTAMIDTPSPSPTVSKRTPTRTSRRTSSRLQSRAALNDLSCLSPATSETSSTRKYKHSRHVNRATDIKNEDDLSYYLERRRKNNEASKMSRAARKQKFGDMDARW